jgi:hypothetical protein
MRYHHYKSLIFGRAFKSSYWLLGKSNWLTSRLLEIYINERRKIEKATGKSRYGARAAYDSTQDQSDVSKGAALNGYKIEKKDLE